MLLPRPLRLTALLVASSLPAVAQIYSWSVLAGLPPQSGSANGTGSDARFTLPFALVTDAGGVTYVAEASGDRIRRITAAGVVTTLAGSGARGAVDGVGANARFAAPAGVTLTGGALFVADRFNHAIRRVTGGGAVTTFAGQLGFPGSADGGPGSARFNEPIGIASDSAGNIYVADSGNHVIRKITPAGEVSTVAGAPGVPGSADGAASVARFRFPAGIRVGPGGSLYVCDTDNHTIRRISPEGFVSTIAGSPGLSGTANGTGSVARFAFPYGLVVYGDGTLLVCDSSNDCIRLITPDGNVSVHTGRPNVQGSRDGARADARFYVPTGITFSVGGLLVADSRNHSIRKIADPDFSVSTFAGPGGNFGREDGVGTQARFNYPFGVGVHNSGDIYVADARGNTIRRITPDGLVTTLVTGGEELYADGPSGVARVNYPVHIAVAPDRSVYFCEQQRSTVRVLRPDGSVTTIAGSEGQLGITDGVGTNARFTRPTGIALDPDGNIYVADTVSSTIRKITAGTFAVTTFAGSPLASGSTDGTRNAARFGFPEGLASDAQGNIYVADWSNHTIRKITPEGVVSTVAGLAGTSGSANGAIAVARFNFPSAVAVDAGGQIFVADGGNHTIRKISGNTVTTLGGAAGIPGYFDGTGTTTWFSSPSGIAIDRNENLYVTESGNNLVRRGELLRPPAITVHPRSLAVLAGSDATLSVSATGGALLYQWRFNGVPISGATTSTYTVPNVTTALTGKYTVAVGNSLGALLSETATLSIASASDAGRIVNLSILTALPVAGDNFTMGFVVGGSGTSGAKPLVIRAAGPSLGALGVADTLEDPRFELFAGGSAAGGNDNWGGSTALTTAMKAVGAFDYTGPASRDAAVATQFAPGNNSVKVSATGSGTGAVIAEIYDATPATEVTTTTPRLINVSVLKHIGGGLTAGFAIGGRADKTVLIRAVGPTLGIAPFLVDGAIADPQLALFSGSTKIGENNDWAGAAALTSAFNEVGAFALPASSRDAALIATLQPGPYTVQVSGIGGTTGIALVEIYEVP